MATSVFVPSALPAYPTPLVGRDQEHAHLLTLIADPDIHLVTLTGAAGIGKTRLAVTVAAQAARDSGHAGHFVALSPITDPDLVLPEIGRSLGIGGAEDVLAGIAAHEGVIVLDNIEQIPRVNQVIATIVASDPLGTILVTSQRPLGVRDERVVWLDPLPLPHAQQRIEEQLASDSCKVFIDRATLYNPSFHPDDLSDESRDAISAICRELDGHPLAIELAASRTIALPPEAVLAQMRAGSPVLSRPRAADGDRHGAIATSIAWSCNLLSDDLHTLYRWLGVFAGGFTLETVDALVRHLRLPVSALDTITELVSLSLVRLRHGGVDPWYVMLAPMRNYCLTELDDRGDFAAANDFLVGWMDAFIARSEQGLTGPDMPDTIAALDRHVPNIRAAIDWSLAAQSPGLACRLPYSCWRFLIQSPLGREALPWVTSALAWSDRLSTDDHIRGLMGKSFLLHEARQYADAAAALDAVPSLLESPHSPEFAWRPLAQLGRVRISQNRLEEARDLFTRTADLARAHGAVADEGRALGNLAMVASKMGDRETARDQYVRALASMRAIGDTIVCVSYLINLSALEHTLGAPDVALRYLEEAAADCHRANLPREHVYVLLNIGDANRSLGHHDDARAASERASELARSLGDSALIASAAVNLARIARDQGKVDVAGHHAEVALEGFHLEGGLVYFIMVADLLIWAALEIDRADLAASILAKCQSYRDIVSDVFDEQECDDTWASITARLPDTSAAVARGTAWDDKEFVRALTFIARRAARWEPPAPTESAPRTFASLTPRENEVLALLTQGVSTADMADRLCVSPRTITTHIANIMAKFDVTSRTSLIARALGTERDD